MVAKKRKTRKMREAEDRLGETLESWMPRKRDEGATLDEMAWELGVSRASAWGWIRWMGLRKEERLLWPWEDLVVVDTGAGRGGRHVG